MSGYVEYHKFDPDCTEEDIWDAYIEFCKEHGDREYGTDHPKCDGLHVCSGIPAGGYDGAVRALDNYIFSCFQWDIRDAYATACKSRPDGTHDYSPSREIRELDSKLDVLNAKIKRLQQQAEKLRRQMKDMESDERAAWAKSVENGPWVCRFEIPRPR